MNVIGTGFADVGAYLRATKQADQELLIFDRHALWSGRGVSAAKAGPEDVSPKSIPSLALDPPSGFSQASLSEPDVAGAGGRLDVVA